jgi:hypothetical protein
MPVRRQLAWFEPSELGSYPVYCRLSRIKRLAARHAVSDRTCLHCWRYRGTGEPVPELAYALSVVGSTWTPGPMVDDTATRLT